MKIYKLLSVLFYYVSPLVVAFLVFYQGQETKTIWSFNGIILLIILFLVFYNKFKAYYKEKKQAHENARNLGQVSHQINFVTLSLGNYFFTSLPFLILILLEQAIKSYNGSIALAVGYLLISFFISSFFDILYYQSEQKKIANKLKEKEREESEKIAQIIKDRL